MLKKCKTHKKQHPNHIDISGKSDNLDQEWEKLKTIKSYDIKLLVTVKNYMDETKDPTYKNIQQEEYDQIVHRISNDTSLMQKIMTTAPELAQQFKKSGQVQKGPSIDWCAQEHQSEWQQLQALQIQHGHIGQLVTLFDMAK